jgi:DnaK suppressor protein
MTDIDMIKTALEARLAELTSRANRIEADLAEPVSADSSEQAIEREDDDALVGQDALLTREIAAVRAAINRVTVGSYGECTRCGEPVGEKRLNAYPEAALCIACAREMEAR